jgi:hypothetical protein
MWYVTDPEEKATGVGLQRVLRLGSYRTAWAWMQKLRRAMGCPSKGRGAAAAAKGQKLRKPSGSHGLQFYRLLRNAVQMTPVPGRKLRGRVHRKKTPIANRRDR